MSVVSDSLKDENGQCFAVILVDVGADLRVSSFVATHAGTRAHAMPPTKGGPWGTSFFIGILHVLSHGTPRMMKKDRVLPLLPRREKIEMRAPSASPLAPYLSG